MLKTCTIKDLAATISRLEDPIILDIRNKKDEKLARSFKRDYRWMTEFLNKGITKVILKKPAAGKIRLNSILKKAKEFQRPIVIVYDNEEHCREVRRIIDDSGYDY